MQNWSAGTALAALAAAALSTAFATATTAAALGPRIGLARRGTSLGARFSGKVVKAHAQLSLDVSLHFTRKGRTLVDSIEPPCVDGEGVRSPTTSTSARDYWYADVAVPRAR